VSKASNYALITAAVGTVAIFALRGGSKPPVDLTSKSPSSKRKRTRSWSEIKGITLHQTGIHGMGKKAWPKVTAHLGVHPDGTVYLIHPLRSYLWHAHDLNKDTIGIEVGGNFRGVESDPDSLWKQGGGPTKLSSAQLRGVRDAINYIMREARKNDGKISRIYAHRQGGPRPVDPGEAIWRKAGLWAQSRYGLTSGPPGYSRDRGQPLPVQWGAKTPRGVSPAVGPVRPDGTEPDLESESE